MNNSKSWVPYVCTSSGCKWVCERHNINLRKLLFLTIFRFHKFASNHGIFDNCFWSSKVHLFWTGITSLLNTLILMLDWNCKLLCSFWILDLSWCYLLIIAIASLEIPLSEEAWYDHMNSRLKILHLNFHLMALCQYLPFKHFCYTLRPHVCHISDIMRFHTFLIKCTHTMSSNKPDSILLPTVLNCISQISPPKH